MHAASHIHKWTRGLLTAEPSACTRPLRISHNLAGNTWYKPPPAASLRTEARAAVGAPVAAGVVVVLAAGLAYATTRRAARAELPVPVQL